MRLGYIRSQTRVLLISIFKYRSRFAITFIGQLVLPVIFNSIFLFALSETETSIYRLALLQYVLLSNMLFTISFSNVENELSSDIRTSRLNYKLLAPPNTLLQYFLKSIINKFFLITIFLLAFSYHIQSYQKTEFIDFGPSCTPAAHIRNSRVLSFNHYRYCCILVDRNLGAKCCKEPGPELVFRSAFSAVVIT